MKRANRSGLGISAILMSVCVSCSNEIHIAEIDYEGISQQESSEYVYFRVPKEVTCSGVRIKRDGDRRRITFIQGASESVDSNAVLAEEAPWTGCLRVEIPIDPLTLEQGGTMTLSFEGPGKADWEETFTYPARSSNPSASNR